MITPIVLVVDLLLRLFEAQLLGEIKQLEQQANNYNNIFYQTIKDNEWQFRTMITPVVLVVDLLLGLFETQLLGEVKQLEQQANNYNNFIFWSSDN